MLVEDKEYFVEAFGCYFRAISLLELDHLGRTRLMCYLGNYITLTDDMVMCFTAQNGNDVDCVCCSVYQGRKEQEKQANPEFKSFISGQVILEVQNVLESKLIFEVCKKYGIYFEIQDYDFVDMPYWFVDTEKRVLLTTDEPEDIMEAIGSIYTVDKYLKKYQIERSNRSSAK